MEKDYKAMLDSAYKELPVLTSYVDRFAVPRADIALQGRKTVIINFKEIADQLRREPDHLLKYLTGEMATLANFDGNRALFQGKHNAESIRGLIEVYAKKYVICPVCGRPDTQLIKEKRLWFLQCEACGARSSIGTG
ncbi:MAG: translation initiation factor IF-2 subunit beta [Candidatus Bathyarchaeota archaeon]|nr:translation initiation factor IF-2 subunit beta [Candidatus Bathyarchaeota archaeon]